MGRFALILLTSYFKFILIFQEVWIQNYPLGCSYFSKSNYILNYQKCYYFTILLFQAHFPPMQAQESRAYKISYFDTVVLRLWQRSPFASILKQGLILSTLLDTYCFVQYISFVWCKNISNFFKHANTSIGIRCLHLNSHINSRLKNDICM